MLPTSGGKLAKKRPRLSEVVRKQRPHVAAFIFDVYAFFDLSRGHVCFALLELKRLNVHHLRLLAERHELLAQGGNPVDRRGRFDGVFRVLERGASQIIICCQVVVVCRWERA